MREHDHDLTHPDQSEAEHACPACQHLLARLRLIRTDRNMLLARWRDAEARAALAEEKLRELQG